MLSEESIQKSKRTYVRKPKVVEPVIEEPIVVEPPVLTRSTNIEQLNNDLPIKRKYVRKVKTDPIPESPPTPKPQTPEPEPEPEPSQQSKKKVRSEKQIAAFNRMREARLKKQQELEGLKQFAKEKELFEKENSKVLKLEEKIIRKASKKIVRKQTESSDEDPCVHQVQTHKNILFV